jgi:hypothetical protein
MSVETSLNVYFPSSRTAEVPSDAILNTVPNTQKKAKVKVDRKKQRDLRVAELSINLIPEENRRSSRAASQAILASELHEAICLCLENNLFMPTFALIRSLIDTCALGIWFLKYAKDEEIIDSVAHLSTPEIVKTCFDARDQVMFGFIFEEIQGTNNQVYRDVLHPSIHGDALHVAMRLRDKKSTKTWVHKCVVNTNAIYIYFFLQFGVDGKLPEELNKYMNAARVQSMKRLNAMFEKPEWRGMADPLSE